MFTLEQVKDYGILRCVGSTKKQLKAIIYIMGAVLEGTGIGIGVVIGVVVSVIIGFAKDINAGFHVLPMIPILIAYFGDLYFVMNENCKLVTKMTPISAVRGEYRIKKEKIQKTRQRSDGTGIWHRRGNMQEKAYCGIKDVS